LVLDEKFVEAAMIYLELAEQGVAVAQLNAAILLDKYDVFDTNKAYLTILVH
jgi:hypothetical protein